jgi:acetyltransferase-like isoleucine patch superfamily enzyme
MRWPIRLPQSACADPVAHITVGSGTYVSARCWLTLSSAEGTIEIGDDCMIGESLTISCGGHVRIGDGTGIGERATIIDQHHDPESWVRPALATGEAPRWGWAMAPPEPVSIGSGCWLGVNVVVMPGVTIGDGCVIGANSVVTDDVPPFSMAAGAPAKVIRSYG